MNQVVDDVIRPLMAAHHIPGMAVAITVGGRSYVFDYGLASVSPKRPMTNGTLFEIGSISKTFTATFAAYAQLQGKLSLSGFASAYLPALNGSAFDKVSLIDLGTHMPGGMPLQVPDGIDTDAELMTYYKAWRPAYAPGTVRTYSNLGIGLLGLIAAARFDADFSTLLQNQMFPAMGLAHTFLNIPAGEIKNYAEGYADDGAAIRMTQGVLAPETYGVRTTAADLLRFLDINMATVALDQRWQSAVTATHTGYFQLQAGKMIQDLVWEQYDLPVTLARLTAGNGDEVLLHPNPATAFTPPLPPCPEAWLNKTGSTNGFGAYVAFIPAERIAIVLLANKSYPIPARVVATYEIFMRLGALKGS